MILFLYKGRYHVRDCHIIENLSAIARAKGLRTDIVYDQDLLGVSDNVLYIPFINKFICSDDRIAQRTASYKPDYVVYMDDPKTNNWAKNIISKARELGRGFKAVLISPFGTEFAGFDYMLNGEPETVFEQFLDRGCSNSVKSEECFNLSELPLPDKALFEKYVSFKDSYLVYTSRGCRHNCSYCDESLYLKRFGASYVRQRSIDSVLKELVWAKKTYNFKEVIFKDAVFTQDKSRLVEFLKEYNKLIAVPFKCYAKAGCFDEDTAIMLKNSLCYCIEFGVQSFNDDIRTRILGRKEKNSDIIKVFEICDKYGLPYDIDHMFGIPNESLQDHLKALRVYSTLKSLNRVKFHNLAVLPGTEMSKIKPVSENIGDFFSRNPESPDMSFANDCFRKLFRLLPLVPKWSIKYFTEGKAWKVMCFMPELLVKVLQLIAGLKKSDRRFYVYMSYYPRKVFFALENLL